MEGSLKTEINISDLKVGHYVVKIVKQQGSLNLSAAGHIKSSKVINNLKNKHVISVLIDPSKTLDATPVNASTVVPTVENSPTITPQRAKVTAQLKAAKAIFGESKAVQKSLFDKALSGANIELSPVIDVCNKSIDAIFNNPDALACVVNIRDKDAYLLEHSVAVSVYITIFARFLKLDREIIEQLAVGAFLHDIGKVKIPDEILHKPGKLTDAEFEIMKTHPIHSIDIIKSTPDVSALSLEVAALHHEKLDGSGYPYQVKGEDISQYGRMIAICDIFDALTATRVYKKAFSHPKAFAILRELAQQNHVDNLLVDQFIKCVGVFPIGSLVQLDSNKLAIIEGRNDKNPIKPKVRSFYSVTVNDFIDAEDIDLAETKDTIQKAVCPEEFDLDMNKVIEMLMMDG